MSARCGEGAYQAHFKGAFCILIRPVDLGKMSARAHMHVHVLAQGLAGSFMSGWVCRMYPSPHKPLTPLPPNIAHTGPVCVHCQHPGHHPRPPPGPHGGHPPLRLCLGREAGHCAALPRANGRSGCRCAGPKGMFPRASPHSIPWRSQLTPCTPLCSLTLPSPPFQVSLPGPPPWLIPLWSC